MVAMIKINNMTWSRNRDGHKRVGFTRMQRPAKQSHKKPEKADHRATKRPKVSDSKRDSIFLQYLDEAVVKGQAKKARCHSGIPGNGSCQSIIQDVQETRASQAVVVFHQAV